MTDNPGIAAKQTASESTSTRSMRSGTGPRPWTWLRKNFALHWTPSARSPTRSANTSSAV